MRAVEEAFAAFNRRDLDAAAAMFAEDAEWVAYMSALESDVYRGRDAIRRMWEEFHERFAGFRARVVELVERGEHVVAVVEYTGAGAASRAPVAATVAHLIRFRDGRAVHVRGFPDKEAALQAAEGPTVP